MSRRVVGAALVAGIFSAGAHAGGIPATELDSLLIIGDRLWPTALSASAGVVTEEQLAARPAARVAELLEFVPGMIATQHSGEGKANQYFLRGFNLDHGTDFATFVDGMPVNLRSHGHGQGYTDLNFLIPELVDRLAYRKGPYYADVGDFSAAGSAQFGLRETLPGRLASFTGGENGYARGLLAAAPALGAGRLLLAADFSRYEGPWVLDQDLSSLKLAGRYSQGSERNGFRLTALGYDSEWTATDQIPARAVADGRIDRLGFVDPTVGGHTSRYSLSFDLQRPADSGHWALNGYAIDYALELYSNFTYFLENPEDGDQFEQLDERQVYGLGGHRHWPLRLAGFGADLELGGELRHDAIDAVGLFKTTERQRRETVRLDRIDQTSLGLYTQLTLTPSERWTLVAGLRADAYRFDVNAARAVNSGTADDQILSPKLNIAYAASETLDLFLNLGRGFHSNDARGTVIRVDPASPDLDPVEPVQPLVAADAVDLGLMARFGEHTHLTATLWALELDSELVFVGDGGATEASNASRRLGVELAAYITPRPWLILDLDYAWSRARFDIDDPADRVPNAVEQVISLGLSVQDRGAWSGGLRLRHLGEAPLIEDNSARSDTTTVANLQLSYAPRPWLTARLDAYNLLDSRDNDITYFYASRLPGEAAAGVEDFHFHPVEPRQLRLSLALRW